MGRVRVLVVEDEPVAAPMRSPLVARGGASPWTSPTTAAAALERLASQRLRRGGAGSRPAGACTATRCAGRWWRPRPAGALLMVTAGDVSPRTGGRARVGRRRLSVQAVRLRRVVGPRPRPAAPAHAAGRAAGAAAGRHPLDPARGRSYRERSARARWRRKEFAVLLELLRAGRGCGLRRGAAGDRPGTRTSTRSPTRSG